MYKRQQYVSVIDETGVHGQRFQKLYDEMIEDQARTALSAKSFFIQDKEKRQEFQRILRVDGTQAAQTYISENIPGISTSYKPPEPTFELIESPAANLTELLPYLRGETFVTIEEEQKELGGVIIFKSGQSPEEPAAEYWSTNVSRLDASRLADKYLRHLAREAYLKPQGLTVAEIDRRENLAAKTALFNPIKTEDKDQGVNKSDTVPFLAATVAAMMLWLTVFSGAYMLLTSMLEEKLNKLLEMMLATTRFSEIILGKLLGVAALTLSMMAPYILVSVCLLYTSPSPRD